MHGTASLYQPKKDTITRKIQQARTTNTLDLSNIDLRVLNNEDMEKMFLAFNDITTVDIINLSNVFLGYIQPDHFNQLITKIESLKPNTLNLCNNKLAELIKNNGKETVVIYETFNLLVTINTVNLSENQFESLPYDQYRNLQSVLKNHAQQLPVCNSSSSAGRVGFHRAPTVSDELAAVAAKKLPHHQP